MRALLLVLIPLTACRPDVLPGTYACGPDGACPNGQTCNVADNTCVLPGQGEPFTCDPEFASEPDDDVSQALEIMGADCLTAAVQVTSCMEEGDTGDWYKLAVPMGCANPALDVRITMPLGLEQLSVEVTDLATNASVATDEVCDPDSDGATQVRCLSTTVTPGATYGIHVSPTGEGDCGGECAFNRYVLRIELGG